MSLNPPNRKRPRDISGQIDQIQEREHFVHFYDKEDHLADGVARFISLGFAQQQVAIVVATPAHIELIDARLCALGLNAQAIKATGFYLAFDAAEILSQFMADGHPDAKRFKASVGALVKHASERGRGVRAFGEMVAILWERDQRQAALELEALWNDLGKQYDFTLYCAYPFDVAASSDRALVDICCHHSRSIGPTAKAVEAVVA